MKLNYFQAGVRAFFEKRDISDNEYSPGSFPWTEWRAGWLSCRKEALP